MSALEVDAMWTLVPEAQFERIAAGTPCMNNKGKRFTVTSMIDQNNLFKMSFEEYTYKIEAVSYNVERPEQQDIIEENLYQVRTLIDLDQD